MQFRTIIRLLCMPTPSPVDSRRVEAENQLDLGKVCAFNVDMLYIYIVQHYGFCPITLSV
jgi:hypothetical protein